MALVQSLKTINCVRKGEILKLRIQNSQNANLFVNDKRGEIKLSIKLM